MTETARTRLLATALDTADNAATVVAGAAAGLAAYRALAARPIETRLTLTAAAGALALCLADQATTLLRRPLRRPLRGRLGLPAYGYTATATTTPATVPSPEQLTTEAAADAAHRAATRAHSLDHGSGSLTQAANWEGASDGSARCELTGDAHLLCLPAPTDRYDGGARTYYLVADGERPIEVHTLAEIVTLLDRLAEAGTLDPETDHDEDEHYRDDDQHGDDEPHDHSDLDDEDDQNPEAREAHAVLFVGCYSDEPPF
ncbi:hypothetical protein ACFWA9_04525 [Kitasatospora sp. NPDC059973]|uniref:hypothetical protein n=1 Tax=Kitasatospora sp. NPDC059973 TaxID=3347020 RepID=UPI00368CD153